MYSTYYAERMMDQRSREIADVQLNMQRVREATVTHDAPYFEETTLPAHAEARMFHSTPSGPRRAVRLGRLMISW